MDLIGLIPSFGNLAFTILAFVAALSVVVAVHEFGHYIVGRWSGIHAEVFSIGFGPVLASRVDRHGTRWQVAALPLGGYVKFLGDGDAASATRDEAFIDRVIDTEREKEIRRSMMGAPLWARSATVAAGPLFNFLLSLAVFAAFFLSQGRAIEPPTVASLPALPPSLSAGLQPGDTILAVEDQPTPDYASFYTALESLPVMPQVEYRVERGGSEATVSGAWPFPVLISSVSPASAAMDARLRVGDVILATDGVPLTAFSQLQERVAAGEGAPMALTIWRNGETLDLTLAPRRTDLPRPEGGFETRWLIGLTGALVFEPQTERIGPGTALLNGGEQVYVLIRSSLSALGHVVTGAISSCNLRGPIGIAEASGQMASQGLVAFIWFVAVLSTAVGFLNLFPIPVLDGGHLVFHAYEAVMRRPPSEKALRVLMVIGLSILLGFMVFALSNDLTCP